jgi:hypothetical protein
MINSESEKIYLPPMAIQHFHSLCEQQSHSSNDARQLETRMSMRMKIESGKNTNYSAGKIVLIEFLIPTLSKHLENLEGKKAPSHTFSSTPIHHNLFPCFFFLTLTSESYHKNPVLFQIT